MINLSDYHIHDLTHVLDHNISGYSDELARSLAVDGWNAKTLTIYSHAGTHMDAPFHFGVSNKTIDDFEPSELMGMAKMVDVIIKKDKQLIELEHVIDQLGDFIDGQSLIVRTNWSKKYLDPDFKANLPRIGESLAQWCVKHRVKLLGVEPLSVADVESLPEVTRIHQILLRGNITIIEGLRNLDYIKANKVFIIALPLKINNGDGAPARVIAFEKK